MAVTLAANTTINSLIIVDDSANNTAETIALGGHTLTIGDSSVLDSTGGLLYTGIAGTNNAAVTISTTGAGTLSFANEGIVYVGTTVATGALSLNANLSGSAALTIDLFGATTSRLTLAGTNTNYSGTTTLASAAQAGSGSLFFAAATNLGTGSLVLDNGTFSEEAGTTNGTINIPVTINGTPTLSGGAASAVFNFTNTVTLAGNSTITQSNPTGAAFGAISDGGNGYALSIAGAKATTFSGTVSGA